MMLPRLTYTLKTYWFDEGFLVNSKDWKAKIHLFVNEILYCNITF